MVRAGETTRGSVSSSGEQGNGYSRAPSISADGNFLAFYSNASNLVPGDTNGSSDVFVYDRQTGQTTRVNVSSFGVEGDLGGALPSISANGRYVAFVSGASNLVPGDTNGRGDVFVYDRWTGQTSRVSVSSSGIEGNAVSQISSLSADGRYVAFTSIASNLVPGDTNATQDIFVHDRQTGETTRVSVSSSGGQGNAESGSPSVSADGRYVGFTSYASNLVSEDTNGTADVFVHDRQTGETTRVSVSWSGEQGNGLSFSGSVSADGKNVVFESIASNLVPADTNGSFDVFLHNWQAGQTTRVSINSAGVEGNDDSWLPVVSADGRYVAFTSYATNLVPMDTNGDADIFIYDRQTGQCTRLSVSSSGVEGNGYSDTPSISPDGRYVAFESWAANLVLDDTNGDADIFVRDRYGGPPIDLDLYVQELELSQAIQNEQGTIPLVADRLTFARVYVGWTGAQPQVVGVDARLRIFVDGLEQLRSPYESANGPITARLAPDAGREEDTINFVFIAPESKDVDVVVELNLHGMTVQENDHSNNLYPPPGEETDLTFECRRTPSIAYVLIDYRPTAQGPEPNLPTEALIKPGNGESFVKAIYPIPGVNYYQGQQLPLTWIFDINNDVFNFELLLALESRWRWTFPTPDFLYGWLPENAHNGKDGQALLFLHSGWVEAHSSFGPHDDRFYAPAVLAHELGHNFGLFHGNQMGGDWGVDVDELVVLPECPDLNPNADCPGPYSCSRIRNPFLCDIMRGEGDTGVLSSPQMWIAPSTYEFLLGSPRLWCLPFAATNLQGSNVLWITGLFDPASTTVTIKQIYELAPDPLTESDPQGNLIVRTYHFDPEETLLYEVRFTAVGVDCGDQGSCMGAFAVVVPALGPDPLVSVDRIDILLSATEQLLAQRLRSGAAPQIAISNPEPGAELLDGMEISWTGSDGDGDVIYYVLSYSWNDGQSFSPLLVDTTETSFILDTDAVPGSDEGTARFRLTATDGMNTVSTEVGALTLDAKKPPIVYLTTPSEGDVVYEEASVVLSGSVHDAEDGELPDGSIVWTSDIDGSLGIGQSLLVASLSLGLHELSVTATDSDEMVAMDSVMIEVRERPSGIVLGDFNFDGRVNLDDFNAFQMCFTSPDGQLELGCEAGDFDGDYDIDCSDWNQFVQAWTEPEEPPSLLQCDTVIPAVSTWGLAAMGLLMLGAGSIVIHRRRASSI